MPDEPTIKSYFVYATPCHCAGKKVGVTLYQITDEQRSQKKLPDVLPEERVYSSKTLLKGLGRPGTIYSIEQPVGKPNTILSGTRQYAGFLGNDDRVLQWQAEHDSFHNAIALEREEKKGKNQNLIRETLAPLRLAYQKSVGRNRTVLLAQIIGYITGRTES